MITQHPLFIKDQNVTVCYKVAQIHKIDAMSLYLCWGNFIQPFYLLTVTFTYFPVTTIEAKLEISIHCAHIIHHSIWLLSWLLGWTYVSHQLYFFYTTGNIRTSTGIHKLLTICYFLNSVFWSLSYFIPKSFKGSMQGDKKEWRGSFFT